MGALHRDDRRDHVAQVGLGVVHPLVTQGHDPDAGRYYLGEQAERPEHLLPAQPIQVFDQQVAPGFNLLLADAGEKLAEGPVGGGVGALEGGLPDARVRSASTRSRPCWTAYALVASSWRCRPSPLACSADSV